MPTYITDELEGTEYDISEGAVPVARGLWTLSEVGQKEIAYTHPNGDEIVVRYSTEGVDAALEVIRHASEDAVGDTYRIADHDDPEAVMQAAIAYMTGYLERRERPT